MKNKKPSKTSDSRRDFLKTAAVTSAGFMIVPRHVVGGPGFTAPSDKLNVAGIGAGGKGRSDLSSFVKGGNVNVVALVDVDDDRAANTRKDYPKAKYYNDYREMLEKERDNIDACSISTPDHTHAVATLAAMQLGKHVYTQKPLTHDIWEARQLTKAAEKYKVVTQMGNQGGSGDGVRTGKEIHDSGVIGTVHTVHAWTNRPVWAQGFALPKGKYDIPASLNWDLWLGPAQYQDFNPVFVPWSWRAWYPFGTGALGDMACHILDPAFRILPIRYPSEFECSIPKSWTTEGEEIKHLDGFPPSSIIHLTYPRTDGKGNIRLSWYDGGILPPLPEELLPGEDFGNWDGGILLIGDKGKLLMDCYGDNPRLLPTKMMDMINLPEQTIPRVPEGHYLQWVNACIAGYGNKETSSPFEFAGPFAESILIGNLAIRSWYLENPDAKGRDDVYLGRTKLMWDAEQMKVTNFDAANQFVSRKYRDGYSMKV